MKSLKLYMKNSSITHYYVVRNFICHELKRPWPQLFTTMSLLHVKKKDCKAICSTNGWAAFFWVTFPFISADLEESNQFFNFSTEQLCKLTSWPKINDRKNLVKLLLALNCLLALKVGRTIGWNNFLTSILVINRIKLYEILFLKFLYVAASVNSSQTLW